MHFTSLHKLVYNMMCIINTTITKKIIKYEFYIESDSTPIKNKSHING